MGAWLGACPGGGAPFEETSGQAPGPAALCGGGVASGHDIGTSCEFDSGQEEMGPFCGDDSGHPAPPGCPARDCSGHDGSAPCGPLL
ncbi:hypothetical protein GCM10020001_019470 [Nonomuraea salmonea]